MQLSSNTVIKSCSDGKNRSHSLTAILAPYAPCIPRFPIKSGWFVGIAPLPMIVVTTGTCVFSTTSVIFISHVQYSHHRRQGTVVSLPFSAFFQCTLNCPMYMCIRFISPGYSPNLDIHQHFRVPPSHLLEDQPEPVPVFLFLQYKLLPERHHFRSEVSLPVL